MKRFGVATAIVVLAVGALSAEPPKLSVKKERIDLPEALTEALRPEFEAEAFTIRDGDAKVLSIRFRKAIPIKASREQIENGLTYREIPEGTLVGLVEFDKAFVDYRKQAIPVGVYTLRIVVQPDTGDHRDTAPYADFVLLSPVADDTAVEPLELKDLVKRSLKSTAGDHPGVMLLYPHFGKDTEAKLVAKGDGVQCLQLRRAVKADGKEATLGFSIVVAGFSKMR